jgi:protein TonB
MLAYAARRPVAERGPAPNVMLAIIALHVAVIAAVMSAKMDLPQRIVRAPLIVDFIHEDDPPPVREVSPEIPQSQRSTLDPAPRVVPLAPVDGPSIDPVPALPDIGTLVGPDPTSRIVPDAVPVPAPVRLAARLTTPASELKPRYPPAKLASGEEALLRLRLTIDERGRVAAVEAIGRADRAFVDAARRHLIAHWRYRPATEDGRAVASTMVITLRFQLEG